MSIAGHCKPFFRGGAAREEFGGILDSAILSLLGTLSGSFGGFLVKIRILKKALFFFGSLLKFLRSLLASQKSAWSIDGSPLQNPFFLYRSVKNYFSPGSSQYTSQV